MIIGEDEIQDDVSDSKMGMEIDEFELGEGDAEADEDLHDGVEVEEVVVESVEDEDHHSAEEVWKWKK